MHAQVREVRERRAPYDRSMADVLTDLVCNLQDILRSQIRLAQAEAREELRTYRSAGVLLLIGILGALLSAFFLLLAGVAALSLVMDVWLAALIVGLGMAVLCTVLVRIGTNLARSRAAEIATGVKEKTPWTGPPSG
jgi:Putative Actinobacterial Holin-X, holin superfamily III